MDPARPRGVDPNSVSIGRVQTWIMSALAVTTILHLAAGLLVAAWFIDPAYPASRYGLAVIAGAFGVLAIAAGRAIHRLPLPSWWLLLGLLPSLVGIVLLAGSG